MEGVNEFLFLLIFYSIAVSSLTVRLAVIFALKFYIFQKILRITQKISVKFVRVVCVIFDKGYCNPLKNVLK